MKITIYVFNYHLERLNQFLNHNKDTDKIQWYAFKPKNLLRPTEYIEVIISYDDYVKLKDK